MEIVKDVTGDPAAVALVHALLLGLGATALADLAAVVLHRLGGPPVPDYSLVGRWIAYMARGRFRHERLAGAPRISGEAATGWVAHYVTGVAFAGVLTTIWGSGPLRAPTPRPALLVGIGTLALPLLVMQPAMGNGIAASRSPRPGAARLRSLLNHALFGVGLYLAGLVLNLALRP
jgi:hypothetical protein